MYAWLMVQVLHRRRRHRLAQLALPQLASGLVRAAAAAAAHHRRITLAVHGAVSRGVQPLAAALAAGIQSADHVDLLVRVVAGRHVVALAVQAQLTERAAERSASGAASRRRLAARLPLGAQRRQVHRYTLKSAKRRNA